MSKLIEKESLQLRLEADFGMPNDIKLTNDEKDTVHGLVEELYASLVNTYLDKNIVELQEDLNFLLELRGEIQTHAEDELSATLVATPAAQRFVSRFRLIPTEKLRDNIEPDIARLESLLKGPLQECAYLRETIEKLTFYISFQQRLPTEILAQIFLQCLGTEHLQIPPNMDLLPWTLGRVCSRWRQVANGEPRLWNQLAIRVVNRRSIPRVAAFMTNLLTKHLMLPISLELESGSKMSIVKHVLPHSSSIRTLSLRFDSPPAVQLLDQPSDSFRVLETMRLVFSQADGGAQQLSQSSVSLFADTPSLRRVEFLILTYPGALFPTPIKNLCLPWGQLTDLSFRSGAPTLITIAHILRQCHCLLNFSLTYFEHDYQLEIPQMVLRNLQSCTLEFQRTSEPNNAFIRALTLPSLKALYIFSPYGRLDDYLSLIDNSGPLEIFTLVGPKGSVEEIEVLIRSMPTLVQLSLPKDSFILETTLAAMASGATLPNIQWVAFANPSTHSPSEPQDIRWASPLDLHKIPRRLMTPRSIQQGFGALHRILGTSITIQWDAIVAAVDGCLVV